MPNDKLTDGPRHEFVTFFLPQSAEFAMILGNSWQLVACSDELKLELWAMVPAGVSKKVQLKDLHLVLYLRALARDDLGTMGNWEGVRYKLTERAEQGDKNAEEA